MFFRKGCAAATTITSYTSESKVSAAGVNTPSSLINNTFVCARTSAYVCVCVCQKQTWNMSKLTHPELDFNIPCSTSLKTHCYEVPLSHTFTHIHFLIDQRWRCSIHPLVACYQFHFSVCLIHSLLSTPLSMFIYPAGPQPTELSACVSSVAFLLQRL